MLYEAIFVGGLALYVIGGDFVPIGEVPLKLLEKFLIEAEKDIISGHFNVYV